MRTITGTTAVRDFILAETGPTLAIIHRNETGEPAAEALTAIEDAIHGTSAFVLRIELGDQKVRAELEEAGLIGNLAGNVWLLSRGHVSASLDSPASRAQPAAPLGVQSS